MPRCFTWARRPACTPARRSRSTSFSCSLLPAAALCCDSRGATRRSSGGGAKSSSTSSRGACRCTSCPASRQLLGSPLTCACRSPTVTTPTRSASSPATRAPSARRPCRSGTIGLISLTPRPRLSSTWASLRCASSLAASSRLVSPPTRPPSPCRTARRTRNAWWRHRSRASPKKWSRQGCARPRWSLSAASSRCCSRRKATRRNARSFPRQRRLRSPSSRRGIWWRRCSRVHDAWRTGGLCGELVSTCPHEPRTACVPMRLQRAMRPRRSYGVSMWL
mmetsp:Transcript_3532/g.7978  ORF Transcript_3532/g.7978 Transcript_3532/m.7978 type:complete len:278 (+) Transcript_3532:378-1211(+)